MLRIILKTLAAIVAGFAALIVVGLVFRGLASVVGLDESYPKFAIWALLAALFFTPKRLFRIKRSITFTAEIDVNAPIQMVWDAVDLREGSGGYKSLYSRVCRVEGSDDVFEAHFAPVLGENGPPPEPLILRRVAAQAPNYLAVHHANEEDTEGFGMGMSAEETFLTKVDDGTTHVRLVETLEYASFWLLVTLFFVSPHKDTLRSLKNYCERVEDTSWAGRTMSEGAGGANSDVMTALVTGCVAIPVIGYATFAYLW